MIKNMTGHLIEVNGNWVVKYENDGNIKTYPLCPESQNWVEKPQTKKFLKENIEIVFDFIVKGEYCETKEKMTKNYFAKIKRVEHESIR